MTTDCHVSISLDGYLAGPAQSLEAPLGFGGAAVHAWHFRAQDEGDAADPSDRAALADLLTPRAAYVMGRNMFGPVRGPWGDSGWRGWWEDEPPYHAPVFVLTHHEHESMVMKGGTTFHFVTGGFDAAYAAAQEVAAGGDIRITGGASTIRQAFAAGVLDELTLDIAPVLLGSGERLFDGMADPGLTLLETTGSPLATHVSYRVDPRRDRRLR